MKLKILNYKLRFLGSIFMLVFFSIGVYAGLSTNLEVEIPSDYKNVGAGDKIWFSIKIFNLAEMERRDLSVKYDVLDSNRNTVVTHSKTVAVQTQASLVESIDLPKEMLEGAYYIKVVVSSPYEGDSGEAETSFNVIIKDGGKESIDYIFISLIILAGIIVILILFFLLKRGKNIITKIMIKMKIRRIVRMKIKNLNKMF